MRTNPFSGYLLFSIHNLDDIPVRFYQTKRAAVKAAKKLGPDSNNPLGASDTSGHIGAKVLRFVNGVPDGQADFYEPEGGNADKP